MVGAGAGPMKPITASVSSMVLAGGPAGRAGIERGDLLPHFDDNPVHSLAMLKALLWPCSRHCLTVAVPAGASRFGAMVADGPSGSPWAVGLRHSIPSGCGRPTRTPRPLSD